MGYGKKFKVNAPHFFRLFMLLCIIGSWCIICVVEACYSLVMKIIWIASCMKIIGGRCAMVHRQLRGSVLMCIVLRGCLGLLQLHIFFWSWWSRSSLAPEICGAGAVGIQESSV
jgi:hypothetical protein